MLTIGAGFQITNLRFDYEFENFFPRGDSSLNFYHDYMDKFSSDVDFVLLAARNDEGIFDEDFLLKAREMKRELQKIEKCKRVISPFDASDFAMGPFGPVEIPYLHPDDPSRYKQDSIRIYTNDKAVGSLFSTDGTSISMVIELQENLSKVQTDSVYFDIMDVVENYEFDELHLAGKAIGQAYYIEQIRFEFMFFFSLGVILITTVLILIYRSIWGVIVPLIVVLLSVVWLLGLMGLTGKPIDIMTALLPLVLFVVGISDVIHLLSRYFEEIRNGKPKFEAIKIAYKQVGMATFLTTVTTALGFFTLVTSSITPVRELGIYAASGVFIAFILAFSLLPAILTLTAIPKLALKEPSSSMWNKLTRSIFRFSLRTKWGISIASILVVIVSLFGISRIEIDNYLLEDIGEGDPHRGSFEFFEDHFAGARPFEMYIAPKDTSETLFSDGAIEDMLAIESYLKKDYGDGVGFMISPLRIIRTVNQALNGGLDSAYVVPPAGPQRDRVLKFIDRFAKRPEFASIMTNDKKEARFSGKVIDIGGKRTKEENIAMEEYFTSEYPLEHVDYELTGMALLIDKNNETLSMDMMTGLLIAFAVVALIMGIIYKSILIALISLIPNMLPLLVIGGVMGLTGIDLKVATSIIFGISFGIAVDDSIHYLSKYKLELNKGKSMIWALRRTSISTGKAIILTTLILSSGFLALATSDFTSTFYVGFLVSITLVFAVLSDLLLLPLLLLWASRWKRK